MKVVSFLGIGKAAAISLFLLILSSGNCFAACFFNFGKQLCHDVLLTPKVIIKSSVSKAELSAVLGVHLDQIAILQDAGLYLVASDDPVKDASLFSQRDEVIYAQPDIIQIKQSAGYSINNLNQFVSEPQANMGEGVRIAVIDDGFNFAHEDLQGVNIAFQYNVNQRNLDASADFPTDSHGTAVAGIIFAQPNELGITGVAPKASFIAIRQSNNRTSETIIALTTAKLTNADVINCSWNSPVLMQPIYDVIVDLTKTGRNGKGTAVVFAAGNEGEELKPFSKEASIPEVISVGAKAKYSNFGDAVDFILPSEFTTLTAGGGYGVMHGTSAAAPIISGLLALEMSTNPEQDLYNIINAVRKKIK